MGYAVTTRGLTVRYDDTVALDSVDVEVRPDAITGLLGRNGAGKTTLLSVLAGHRRATGGVVEVDAADPYEDPRVMSGVVLVGDHHDTEDSTKVHEALEIAESLRPAWDPELATSLVARFGLDPTAKISSLSRGQGSALAVSMGLATCAPLTIFDEPHLGMDAPSRYAFYDALLEEFTERPRTFVLSTHLIDEVASLFDDVVILHRGRVLRSEPAESLRSSGVRLTGPTDAVEQLVAGDEVLGERRLGRTAEVVVHRSFDDRERVDAHRAGVDVEPLPLQDLFVHLTDDGSGAPQHRHGGA